MSKGVKSQNEDRNAGIVREVFGLTVILFSLLAFLCLVTGDSLFYTVGLAVRNFLLGSFGAYAYLFLIHFAMWGVTLVSGKPIIPDEKRLTAFLVRVIIVCVFLLVHLSVSFDGSLGFNEEVAKAYSAPSEGATTVGGVVASVMILPISLFASKVGAYIVYIAVILVIIAFFSRKLFSGLFAKRSDSDSSTSAPAADREQTANAQNGANDQQAPVGREQGQRRNGGFFINEQSGFAFRSKSEMTSGRRQPFGLPFQGEFRFKNIADVALREAYDRSRPARQQQAAPERPAANNAQNVGMGYDPNRTVGDYANNNGSPFSPDRSIRFGDRTGNRSQTRGVSEPIERESVTSDFVDSRVYTIPVHAQSQQPSQPEPVDSFNDRTSYDRTAAPAPTNLRGAFGGRDASFDGNSSGASVSGDNEYSKRAGRVISYSDSRGETQTPAVEKPLSESVYTPSTSVSASAASESAPQGLKTERETNGSTVEGQSTDEVVFDDLMHGDDDGSFAENVPTTYSLVSSMPDDYRYVFPNMSLLKDYSSSVKDRNIELQHQEEAKKTIIELYKNAGIEVTIANVVEGAKVTRYDVAFPANVRLQDMHKLDGELEFRLLAMGKYTSGPVPDTLYFGITVPSHAVKTVGLRKVFANPEVGQINFENSLSFMVGEGVLGDPIFLDLKKIPHILICGTTGSGKSVCLNTMLVSLMYKYTPEQLRFIIIDPKNVEFTLFENSPFLLFNKIIEQDPDGRATKVLSVLQWVAGEMNRRYNFLKSRKLKGIIQYNAIAKANGEKIMPYLLVVIDEFADIVLADPESAKVFESIVSRLTAKSRAAGITLILATQRPSTEVITGTIKSNIATRICFQTASAIDSRIVLDQNGAETLLGRGDCFIRMGSGALTRAQGAYLDDELELPRILSFIHQNNKSYYNDAVLNGIERHAVELKEVKTDEDLPTPSNQKGLGLMSLDPAAADEDVKRALRLAIVDGTISASRLRTYFRMGYNKASSILIWMSRMKYISEPLENKTRKTLITREQYEQLYGEFVVDWEN